MFSLISCASANPIKFMQMTQHGVGINYKHSGSDLVEFTASSRCLDPISSQQHQQAYVLQKPSSLGSWLSWRRDATGKYHKIETWWWDVIFSRKSCRFYKATVRSRDCVCLASDLKPELGSAVSVSEAEFKRNLYCSLGEYRLVVSLGTKLSAGRKWHWPIKRWERQRRFASHMDSLNYHQEPFLVT